MASVPMPGGLTGEKPANSDVQQITDGVRSEVEAKVGRKFEEYEAVRFRTQVVAGVNYFVKMRVATTDYIHTRIYVPLPGQGGSTLTSVQTGKTEQDPIEFFD
ncbi:hypothetical protein ScPMuIL_013375 [Solemya velum]